MITNPKMKANCERKNLEEIIGNAVKKNVNKLGKEKNSCKT